MKQILLVFLILIMSNSFALDTEVKGFVALNTFSYESVEDRDPTMKMGIGTIDLKFYFNHEDFSAKIKLDLDGQLDESNNLYEEAMVNWRPIRNWKFSIGKGKIRFHQMSYGVLESHYSDGGSVLGTTHGLRDQDRKIVAEVVYGGYRRGFRNYLSFYADTKQPSESRDSDNLIGYDTSTSSDPTLAGKGELTYETEKEINTRKDVGFSNKFFYYPRRGVEFGLGVLYRDRKVDFNDNWAFDFSGKYSTGAWEYVFELVYAYVSNHPNDKYAVEHQYEQMGQIQVLYQLTEMTKLKLNAEVALVNTQQFNRDNLPNGLGDRSPNFGNSIQTNNYKLDVGIIWKLAARVNFKVGALYERKYEWKALQSLGYTTGYAGFRDAWQLGSGINFWF